MKFEGIIVENRMMSPIECDDCHAPMGYGWDAEYSYPQSVFRCRECYDRFSFDSSQREHLNTTGTSTDSPR